jgi:O-antigen ligase
VVAARYVLPHSPAYRTGVVAAALLLFALALLSRRLSFVTAVLAVTVSGVSALACGFGEPVAAGAVVVSGYFAGAFLREIYEVGAGPPPAQLVAPWWGFVLGASVSAAASLVEARSAYLLLHGVPPPRAVNVLGTDASQAVAATISALAVLAVAAGFYQATSWLSRRKSGEQMVDLALLLAALTAGSVAFLQKIGVVAHWRSVRWAEWQRAQSTFTDPSAAGVAAALLIAPLLAIIAKGRLLSRVAATVAAILLLVVVTESGSRAGLIGLLVSTSLFGIWAVTRLAAGDRPGVRRKIVRVAGGLALLLALTFSVSLVSPTSGGVRSALLSRLERTMSGTSSPSESAAGRVILYEAAVTMFRESPVAGNGLGSFLFDFPNVAAGRLGRPVKASDYPPSFYLGVLAEMGLAGGLLLAFVLTGMIRGIISALSFQEVRTSAVLRAAGAAAAIAGILVVFLFGSHLVYPEVAALTGIIAARLRFPVEGKTGRFLTVLFPVGLAAALVPLAGSVAMRVAESIDAGPAFQYQKAAGVFPVEREDGGRPFRWTGPSAAYQVELSEPGSHIVLLPVRNSRPDQGEVFVNVFFNDRLQGRVAIPWGRWSLLEAPVPAPGVLRLVLSATFRPIGTADRRTLGIQVGEKISTRRRVN